jgi:hypothetical protein
MVTIPSETPLCCTFSNAAQMSVVTKIVFVANEPDLFCCSQRKPTPLAIMDSMALCVLVEEIC